MGVLMVWRVVFTVAFIGMGCLATVLAMQTNWWLALLLAFPIGGACGFTGRVVGEHFDGP